MFLFIQSLINSLLEPHFILELVAYSAGFQFYRILRKRKGDHIVPTSRTAVIAAAIAGGAFGSKLLYWLSDPVSTLDNWKNLAYLMGGKTIVGGLIGGLIAVEITKRLIGENRRTGDLFALPLCAGIAIGRIGCFLGGLSDDTYGVATSLSWGVDFGDGIRRHPTQLYETAFMILLAAWIAFATNLRRGVRPVPAGAEADSTFREGDAFRAFMVGYLGFRLLVDFIKPGISFFGFTAIQWACLLTLIYYWRDLPYIFRFRNNLQRGIRLETEVQ